MNVGNRITYFRQQKGYSTNKLANLAGVSQSYLRDVEKSNKNPTIDFLSIICDTLEISLKDFFDEKSTNNVFDDALSQKIYQLNATQRQTLLDFLKSIL